MRKSHIYCIKIENKSKLENVASVEITRAKAVLFGAAAMILILALATLILLCTPLWSLRSRQLSPDERRTSIDALLLLDSLKTQAERNDAFIANLLDALNPDRIPADSAAFSGTPKEYPVDSLKERSLIEQSFVARMDDKERYNISVLAPLAAEDVEFYDISAGMVQTKHSLGKETAEIITTTGHTVNAPSDARVVDAYYSPTERGYAVVLQQQKGFVTRFSGLGTLLVKRGDNVEGGEAIAYGNAVSSHRKGIIRVEMWHNGHPLIPGDYIFHHANPDEYANPPGPGSSNLNTSNTTANLNTNN